MPEQSGEKAADGRAVARIGARVSGKQRQALAGRRTSPLSAVKNQSIIRAFAILKSFYSPDEWVAACELSRRTNIHEATVNRFMQSLTDVGAVVRDEQSKYRCVLFALPDGGTGGAVLPYAAAPDTFEAPPRNA